MARRNGVCTACRKAPALPPAQSLRGVRAHFRVSGAPFLRRGRHRTGLPADGLPADGAALSPTCPSADTKRTAAPPGRYGSAAVGVPGQDDVMRAWAPAGMSRSSGTAAQSTTTAPGRAATRARASDVDETDTSMPAYCARYALRRDGEAPEPWCGAAVGVPSPATTRNAGGAAAADSGARPGRPALAPPHAALRGLNPGVGRHGRGATRFDGGWNAWC